MTAPKFLVAFAAAALLSACASDPETAATTGTGDANAGVIRPGSQEDPVSYTHLTLPTKA